MSKIENSRELRAEISRLRIVIKEKEQLIKNDLKEISNDFKPENFFGNAIRSFTGINMKRGDFFKDGVVYGLSLLVQRFILKTETKLENKAYNLIDTIFERLRSVINKNTDGEAKRAERNSEPNDSTQKG